MIRSNNKLAVVSLSGGMDSTTLLLRLIKEGYEVFACSFNYGQKHSVELERAKLNIEYLQTKGYNVKHKIIDLSSAMGDFKSSLTSSDIDTPEGFYADENMKKTVVPNRNAIFSAIVYGQALSLVTGVDKEAIIALGIHAGDHAIYPDCRQEFRDAIDHAFRIGNWESEKISYYAPYLNDDKYSILKDGLVCCEALELDFDIIYKNTNTSYNPDPITGKSSGTSGADVERILAFHQLGRKDPVEYINTWENVLENALKVEKQFNEKVAN